MDHEATLIDIRGYFASEASVYRLAKRRKIPSDPGVSS